MASIPIAAFRFTSESAAAVKDVRSMGREVGKVDKGTKDLNLSMAKLGGIVGAGVIAGFVKQAADAADALGKTADRIGLSTESLVTLRAAAIDSGSSVESLDRALEDANKRLGEAIRGTGEARSVIQGLGLDINELRNLSPDELFRTYASAVSELSSRAEQTAAAQALFGEGAKTLIPIITDGGAALDSAAAFVERYGLALSRVEIKQVELANTELSKIAQISEVAGQRIAVGLAPMIEFLATKLLDATGNTRDLQEHMETFSAVAITGFEIVANAARALEAAFFGLAAGGARVAQALTFGDVSESFAASVDANLSKADAALQRIKSIEEIQQSVVDSLERSRLAAEAAASASGFGDQTLGTVSYDVGGVDFGQIEADLQAEYDLRSEFLAQQVDLDNAAHSERLAAERQFIARRALIQEEAQDLFNRITQGGVMFEIRLHELKNQTLLQSGASLVGAILTSNKKLAKAKQAFEIAQTVWATGRGIMQAAPNLPLMAAVAAAGALNLAKIRAMQYFEGGVGGGGGVTPGLQLAAPAPTQSDTAAPMPTGDPRVAQIIVQGNVFSTQESAEWFLDQVSTHINDRDKVVISRTSAQARELIPE